MKMKNLSKELKSWLRHWYLAAKHDPYLTSEARKEEPKAYREIQKILGDERIISKMASPLS
jgi:hypothetical protein